MSFGQATRKRFEQLRKQGQNVPKIMKEVAEGATIAAVERATELTPPNGGADISGVNTREGGLGQHWTLDSTTKPIVSAASVTTILANNLQHASYVNDGHNMHEHFVPGLGINGGLLEMDPSRHKGLMVGTKTKYVKGRYMKQAAVGKYKGVVKMELDKQIRGNFR